jgi:hypothetical protein
MDKGRQPEDRPRREEVQPEMDEERQIGAKRPDTLRPGPIEGRTREGERGPGVDDDRSIATEEDDEELELDDDDEDIDDEDAEDEGRPARPVK